MLANNGLILGSCHPSAAFLQSQWWKFHPLPGFSFKGLHSLSLGSFILIQPSYWRPFLPLSQAGPWVPLALHQCHL